MKTNRITVKAIDGEEWALDVLGVPFGGPHDGRDRQGEFFTPQTDLWLDKIPKRPVVFYHGMDERGKHIGPEIIGQEVGHEAKADGVWFRVILDKTKEKARAVWRSAQRGLASASSGALSHLVSRRPNGEITVWPMGELSLLDETRTPVNSYAVAVPALKAVYQQAGLTLPDIDGESVSEATAKGPSGQSANAVDSASQTREMQKRALLYLALEE